MMGRIITLSDSQHADILHATITGKSFFDATADSICGCIDSYCYARWYDCIASRGGRQPPLRSDPHSLEPAADRISGTPL
jgi:hypothetical protein